MILLESGVGFYFRCLPIKNLSKLIYLNKFILKYQKQKNAGQLLISNSSLCKLTMVQCKLKDAFIVDVMVKLTLASFSCINVKSERGIK